ncbi:TolC family protein [Janthinobacterium agaricidamnosum]|uniref:Outer membrane efflux family protein n=1 Tax=Janthinobacterium agaricidamnosum NBRC 102515 = DSM 9628 TaxID=1349767 RepID=W0V2D8_9BURK|nr:TolC family protein [Janthinobacterium agaricidamnosum]CDG81508.1 outer membrane efflux family protein [Janthinobacterium agaricidamnosum NBRC 102515 = DSM 9628]
MKKSNRTSLMLLGVAVMLQGLPTAHAGTPLRFADYLDAVEKNSLDLQAQHENVTSAQAGIGIAGIRPDPVFAYGASRELVRTAGSNRPVTHNPSLAFTIETGGKRDARIKAARSNLRLAEETVAGFKSDLYNSSAAAFAEACRTRDVLARKEQTVKALSEVVRVNQVRNKTGDVGGLELLQSRVERDQFKADVVQARSDAAAAMLNLSPPLGRNIGELFPSPELACEFSAFHEGDDAGALIPQALNRRGDVRIARATLDNLRDGASLARANRSVDPTVTVGISALRGYPEGIDASGEPTDATSRSRVLSVSLSVPIPLSRRDKGDLVQAESLVTQAMLGLRQAELKAETEVRIAQNQFMAARDNLTRYHESVLADAQKVLDGMRVSYSNGNASILELLSAQRSADDAWQAYLQARADLATATVQLQLSIGQRPAL